MTVVEEWGDLRPGDVFHVTGERGTEYSFLSCALNDAGEVLHINAVGGNIGRKLKDGGNTRTRAMRAFRPERIIIPDVKALAKQRKLRKMKTEGT